ncbi:hypothetical protein FACS1894204_09940 [Synergistales bacterium]|nr:hypothetical protein FACS1894204_09940 [Synergistales bacterium]
MAITRANPSCLVFMLDQSASMEDPFHKGEISKASQVASIVNRVLHDTVMSCVHGKATYDYFDIAVIGYGADKVSSALGGDLGNGFLFPISTIRRNPIRKDGDTPIWVEPVAEGSTPMRAAFEKVYGLLGDWLSSHKDAVPPVVMNITDGEGNDGNPADFALKLMELSNNVGKICLLNAHLTDKKFDPVLFPADDSLLKDDFAKALFAISSPLTDDMVALGKEKYPGLAQGARGFVYNADAVIVTDFLDIGTKKADLR